MNIVFNSWQILVKNSQYNLFLLGLLILPIIPALGVFILLIVVIKTFTQQFNIIKKQKDSILLLIITFWFISTCIVANNNGEAWLGLANLLPFFCLFLSVKTIVKQIRQLKIITLMISGASILIVILGLGQLYWGWSSPQILYTLTGWNLVLNGVPPERMSAVFIHANLLSLYLITSLILSSGLWLNKYLTKFNSIKQGVDKNKYPIKLDKITIFLCLTIIFDLVGLILTNSRNGWIIAFLALIAFCFYCQWYKFIQLLTMGGIVVAWASFGNLPGQNWLRKIVPDYLWQRLSDEAFSDRPLATLRTTQWQFCLDLVSDRPIFGWGIRNFGILYKQQFDTYLGHPHNLFLMFMAETGIVGFMLLMVFVGRIVGRGVIALKYLGEKQSEAVILFSYLICFTGYIIFNSFDVSIFDLRSNTLGWIILGCIAGVSDSILKITPKS